MLVIREHLDIIHSTQDYAREQLKNTDPDCCFLYTADEQTQGRATKQKIWLSPAKLNLYATYTIHVPINQRNLFFHLPQVVGLSIVEVLENVGFAEVEVKWVNDVLIHQKKVCGILCESDPSVHPGLIAVLIGIGVNVNVDKDFCQQVIQPVTSLKIECGKIFDKEIILEKITERLLKNISHLLSEGFQYFYSRILTKIAFREEYIQLDLGNKIIEGILDGIDSEGRLQIRIEENQMTRIEKFMTGSILRHKKIAEFD